MQYVWHTRCSKRRFYASFTEYVVVVLLWLISPSSQFYSLPRIQYLFPLFFFSCASSFLKMCSIRSLQLLWLANIFYLSQTQCDRLLPVSNCRNVKRIWLANSIVCLVDFFNICTLMYFVSSEISWKHTQIFWYFDSILFKIYHSKFTCILLEIWNLSSN